MAEQIKRTVKKASDSTKKAASETKETVKKNVTEAAEKAESTAKKTVEKAGNAVKDTAEKAKTTTKKTVSKAKEAAEETTEKVKDTSEKIRENGRKIPQAKPTGNATLYRILAVVCWVIAIGLEVCAVLTILEKIELPMPIIWGVIIFLVADLIFCVLGSQLWKKANHIDPASEKNPLKFWLWNNIGVIMAAVAFLPFVILALTSKNTDQKTKTIAVIAAVACLAISGLAGYDWNPISQEQKSSAEHILEGVDVYWTNFGHRYHLDMDCSSLGRSENLTKGTVTEAIADGKTHLCKFCYNKFAEENPDLINLIAE